LTDHIALDMDTNASNELQNLSLTGSVLGLSGTAGTVNLAPLLGDGGTDNQNIESVTLNGSNILTIEIENGDPATVDLSSLSGGTGGSDNQNLGNATLNGSNILTIEIEDGNPTTVDLSALAGGSGGSDDQTISLLGNIVTIEDGGSIDLTPVLGAGSTDDQILYH